jgi:carbon monoxide dehydrogenase subunit G
VLLDVEKVAPCMPGATIDSVDGDEIRGRIKVKVGPINMTYAGTARFVERDKSTGVVRLEASGKETRGAGTASATVRSVLEDRGANTDVVVLTTLNVTGKPAQFGRGVMNEVGGKLLSIFANNLAATLAADVGAAGSGPATAEASASERAAEPAALAGQTAAAGAADSIAPSAAGGAPSPTGGASVDDLHLPARAAGALQRAGIETVGQLATRTEEELLAMDGIGPASVVDIKAKLADHGLDLGQAAAGSAEAPAPAATPAAAAAPAAHYAATTREAAHQLEDDAINLFKVAGMPVLKRAIPVAAALVAALLIGLRQKVRRRNRS